MILNFPFYSISSYFHKNLSLVLVLCIAILIAFGAIHTSFGHAFVINSNPSQSESIARSPQQIDVFFSEPVDLRYSHLKVLDSNGKQVDKGDVRYLQNDESKLTVSIPPLKDGTYTVSTNVLSQTDGHVTDNAFVFAIGQGVLPQTNLKPLHPLRFTSRSNSKISCTFGPGNDSRSSVWQPLDVETIIEDCFSK